MTSGRSSDGILFVAFGSDYVVMALNAIETLRRLGDRTAAAIITNLPEHSVTIDTERLNIHTWRHIDVPVSENRLIKTSAPLFTPFARTIMVDCDVEFRASPAESFALLNSCDVALSRRKGSLDTSRAKSQIRVYNGLPAAEMPHWTGNLLLFKDSVGADAFFSTWHAGFRRAGVPYDQISLVEAVLTSDAKIHELARTDRRFVRHYASRMTRATQIRCLGIAQESLDRSLMAEARAGIRWKTRGRPTRVPLRGPLLWLLHRLSVRRRVRPVVTWRRLRVQRLAATPRFSFKRR
jgi:hypothetical protein